MTVQKWVVQKSVAGPGRKITSALHDGSSDNSILYFLDIEASQGRMVIFKAYVLC